MRAVRNPFRGAGLDHPALADIPFPLDDADPALARVARCPRHRITPLLPSADLADAAGVARVFVKDERARMGLGSFKALGAAHVIACDAAEGRAAGRTYVAASAGNHGLSVAAGAAAFGATSRIYLADTVPESFADRLRAEGAEVRRAGATYEESMATAEAEAADEGLTLLSDSSWPGYTEMPRTLMEGYLILMAEAASQLPEPPSHILLQAGVGGLAGAAAAHARRIWGDDPVIVVVEPEAAPALIGSIEAGAPTESQGPVSIMGRLDCKMPSLIALKGLARDADWFVTITEGEAQAGCDRAEAAGLPSTPSGAAGLAALVAGLPDEVGITQKASILTILSETA
ncbi:diaminopropionate ammonia-lyase [Maritimibacter alkaliphilus HTCC2654]|uniref:Diaminopropionate ammonia-lyase n=1 Tax=Maritimibacter alkaliphilus HTCC2654 TaxID=314271 RepID=A3VKQ2_9RHOB|nr:pyridoxal-phosphate dependent enzyme [Maritimibacter alkaliphilus]EAQ11223.1 diaminopropionate ammonia-lyase [Rhodobacterales bacterium HTCC2654] [Maritimibacter alkaliphilus HTCC2654]TYP83030.1 diaminopropionate ammonia-lyase [Maritimibacter alkaliphilus HTCC2654]